MIVKSDCTHVSMEVRKDLLVFRLQECMKEKKEMVDRMDSVASTMKEHSLLMTIPCVAPINSIRLLSQDRRHIQVRHPKVAGGICKHRPVCVPAGRMTGEHRSITKKENPNLRATLYLIVKSMLKHKPDSKIARYVRGIIHTILSKKADYSENG